MWESIYLSKRLDIGAGDVAEVAARWHQGLEQMHRGSRMARASKGFWLASAATDSAVAYEVRGLAWTCGRPVPVILEFAEWSATQSEVGVSPRSLLWPVGTGAYFRRVTAALENIGRSLYAATDRGDVPRECQTVAATRLERIRPQLQVTART